MTQRLVKHPYLAIFDGPDTNTSTDVRPRSTVPLQALYLMNNPFVQEQSAALARRLLGEARDIRRRLERAGSWPGAGRRRPGRTSGRCRYPGDVFRRRSGQRRSVSDRQSSRPGPAWPGSS